MTSTSMPDLRLLRPSRTVECCMHRLIDGSGVFRHLVPPCAARQARFRKRAARFSMTRTAALRRWVLSRYRDRARPLEGLAMSWRSRGSSVDLSSVQLIHRSNAERSSTASPARPYPGGARKAPRAQRGRKRVALRSENNLAAPGRRSTSIFSPLGRIGTRDELRRPASRYARESLTSARRSGLFWRS